MAVQHVFASIPVADRDAAVAWYERFFGHPPDLIPNQEEAAWRVTDTAWIYVVTDARRLGSAYSTLLVDDIDAFLGGLVQRGIPIEPVETMADVGVRHTVITDPDGNRIQIGQPPG